MKVLFVVRFKEDARQTLPPPPNGFNIRLTDGGVKKFAMREKNARQTTNLLCIGFCHALCA
jgi:hypothetical protein